MAHERPTGLAFLSALSLGLGLTLFETELNKHTSSLFKFLHVAFDKSNWKNIYNFIQLIYGKTSFSGTFTFLEKFYLHPINLSIHPNLYLRKNWDVIYMGYREKWVGCK